jgi:hypothetical protein
MFVNGHAGTGAFMKREKNKGKKTERKMEEKMGNGDVGESLRV